jgi:6-phosphogluconolactonase (cycloisomerase 2 family)
VSQRWAASSRANPFIYISQNNGAGEVAGYESNSKTGVLTQLPGSPVSSGQSSIAVAVDPAGQYVYSVDNYGYAMYGYIVDSAAGALTHVPGSTYIYLSMAVIVINQEIK